MQNRLIRSLLLGIFVVFASLLIYWLSSSIDGHIGGAGNSEINRRNLSFYQPNDVRSPEWIAQRQSNQLARKDQLDVFTGFTFEDVRLQSGIDFLNRVVDDASKYYKPVHYDHGNGISVADVDNDGLYDIYFTNQVGGNALWKNLGDGEFLDITSRAGVDLDDRISVTSSFADVDNDGDQDLFVTTVRFGNVLFENLGDGRFRDITRQAGLDYSGHSSGGVFFDYDRDGLLDLFLCNVGIYTTDELADVTWFSWEKGLEKDYEYYVGIADTAFTGHLYPQLSEKSILYRNTGDNRFEDVSDQVGLSDVRWTGDAVVIDANDDGWQDLYVLNMQGDDGFYQNMAGERFELKTHSFFSKTPYGSMGVEVFDADNDGSFDLFVTDMHSDMWETNDFFEEDRERQKPLPQSVPPPEFLGTAGTSIFGNALFLNKERNFDEQAEAFGLETYWPWGVSAGDLNADGYQDLFITTSMNFPFRYAQNKVMLNNRGNGFVESEFILGVEPRQNGDFAKKWYELDCVYDTDAFCENFDPYTLIDVWGAKGSRASVLFDMDNDGDLDIVTNEFNSEPQVLRSSLNESKEALNYMQIVLEGTVSNKGGLGAVVEVVVDENTSYRQAADGKSGYLSQSALPLYFGLGEAASVERITVTWPSGIVQAVSGPSEINTTLKIVESR